MGKAVGYGVAAVVILGGAYVGLAAYSGNQIEKEYEAASAKMTQTLPFIKIVDQKHDKGLFSATHTTSLQIGCEPAQDGDARKPMIITLRDTIAHGPLPGFSNIGAARIDTQVVLPPEAPEALRKWVASMKPEDIRTVIDFGGAASTRMSFPEGQFNDEKGQVQWKRMQASFKLDGAKVASSYSLSVPEVTASFKEDDQEGGFKLMNLHGEGSGKAAASGLFMVGGKGVFALDKLEINVPEKKMQVNLNQLKYVADSDVQNDLVQASASLTGVVDVQQDGKSFKFDKIELQESMKRMHAPTLRKIVAHVWEEAASCKKPSEESFEARQAKQEELMGDMKQLLTFNPEYSVDKIAVQYEGQEGVLAYSVAVNGVTAQDVEGEFNPRRLIDKVTAKANVKLPIAWLEKILAASGGEGAAEMAKQKVESMIGGLVAAGYATREDPFVSSNALFEKGQIQVNGKPFSMAELMH